MLRSSRRSRCSSTTTPSGGRQRRCGPAALPCSEVLARRVRPPRHGRRAAAAAHRRRARPVARAPSGTASDGDGALRRLTPAQRATFEEELELDFAYTLLGDEARFRVNVYKQRDALGRGLPAHPHRDQVARRARPARSRSASFADLPRGLVLVTGPTGSGKSTTLAALIDRANETRADHIMTIEDPIEFVHTSKKCAGQPARGRRRHAQLRRTRSSTCCARTRTSSCSASCATSSRSRVALTAAETGHLVFATLHTPSAAQSIDRIIDVFPPHQQQQVRMQLSLMLQGVVCQTLVPRADGQRPRRRRRGAARHAGDRQPDPRGKTSQITTAMQTGSALGMQTMDQHLAELINDGVITIEAATAKAQDVETLRQMVAPARPRQTAPAFSAWASDGGAGAATTRRQASVYRARHAGGKVVKGALDVPSEAPRSRDCARWASRPVKVAEKAAGTGLQRRSRSAAASGSSSRTSRSPTASSRR